MHLSGRVVYKFPTGHAGRHGGLSDVFLEGAPANFVQDTDYVDYLVCFSQLLQLNYGILPSGRCTASVHILSH
jgi:hypothetical protein